MKYNIGNCFICKSGVIRIEEVLKHSYITTKYYFEFKGSHEYKYTDWQIDNFFKPINSIFIDKAAKLLKLNYNAAKTIKENSKAKRTCYYINFSNSGYLLQYHRKVGFITTYINFGGRFYEEDTCWDFHGSSISKKEYKFLKEKASELEKELEAIWQTIEQNLKKY